MNVGCRVRYPRRGCSANSDSFGKDDEPSIGAAGVLDRVRQDEQRGTKEFPPKSRNILTGEVLQRRRGRSQRYQWMKSHKPSEDRSQPGRAAGQ